jgi:FkbM family methyltransferase
MHNIVQKIILLDSERTPAEQKFVPLQGIAWQIEKVPVISIWEMIYNSSNEILFYQPDLDESAIGSDVYFKRCFEQDFCQYSLANNLNFFGSWYANQPLYEYNPPYYCADYFCKNRQYLEISYQNLYDFESKSVFAAAVKVKITGNYMYMPYSRFPQYSHPSVVLRPGDVVIDAGVSGTDHGATHKFLNSVGTEGSVFGFEPGKNDFKLALEKLGNIPNYKLLPFGLLDRDCVVNFSENPNGGSHVIEGLPGGDLQTCEIKTLDTFCLEYKLSKVDFIKMDIEGSELKALQGAENILRQFKPNLAICIYHKPQDLYEIILYLLKLDLGYKFFCGHHGPYIWDTVLYATARHEQI